MQLNPEQSQNTADKKITEAELMPGDIIFTLNADGTAAHAAIWAPTPGSLRPLAHAVKNEKTRTITKTGIMPDNYTVFRPVDTALAQLAAETANRWCRFETPYDEQRLQIGERSFGARTQHVQGGNPQEVINNKRAIALKAAKQDFDDSGRYRMVKYASRRMGPAHLPKEMGSGRGDWCSMFALMCYQTAAMAKNDLVEPLTGGDKQTWVSDKYADLSQLKQYQPEKPKSFSIKKFKQAAVEKKNWSNTIKNYSKHVEHTRSEHEFTGYKHYKEHKHYKSDHQTYPPSIVAWDFDKNGDLSTYDFSQDMPESLMLEQKTIDPDVLMASLAQDTDKWVSPGVVVIDEKTITKDQSDANRTEKEVAKAKAGKLNGDVVNYLHGKIEKLPEYDKDVQAEKEVINRFKM